MKLAFQKINNALSTLFGKIIDKALIFRNLKMDIQT